MTTTNYYPSANAVPLNDNNHNAMAVASSTTAVPNKEPSSFREQYATAQVVGTDVSPFSTRLVQATETHATATALDPWSIEKTIATETEEREEEEEEERPTTFVYRPPTSSSSEYNSPNDYNNNNDNNIHFNSGTANLPAAALEDPLHKKYRRRKRRRGRMIAGGATGFVVGSLFLGPLGAIAFGIGGASAARSVSKAGERRKDRRIRRRIRQIQQQSERGRLERVVITRR